MVRTTSLCEERPATVAPMTAPEPPPREPSTEAEGEERGEWEKRVLIIAEQLPYSTCHYYKDALSINISIILRKDGLKLPLLIFRVQSQSSHSSSF